MWTGMNDLISRFYEYYVALLELLCTEKTLAFTMDGFHSCPVHTMFL